MAASILFSSAILQLSACGSLPSSRAASQINQFQNLLPEAEKGNLEAEDDLGYLYQTGEGTSVDDKQAVIWYRRAAEDGYAPAERHLGYLYERGLGIPQDYSQAVIWYRRAAQQGDAWAENNIGSLYATSHGVPQDYQLSQLWFTRAASQRNPTAEVNLGDLYLYGLGTSRDSAAARQWYTLAAVHGDFTAQLRLGWLYLNGLGVTRDKSQAAYWFGKAATHRFDSLADFNTAVHAVIDASIRYPTVATSRNMTGTAWVVFTYANGRATNARLEQSSGSAVLDEAALQTVNQALFPLPPAKPLTQTSFTVSIQFSSLP